MAFMAFWLSCSSLALPTLQKLLYEVAKAHKELVTCLAEVLKVVVWNVMEWKLEG